MNRETPSSPPLEREETLEERKAEALRRLTAIKEIMSDLGATIKKIEDLIKD